MEGSDPRELTPGFEVSQIKGTHIGVSELTLSKSYEASLLRIRPLCFLEKGEEQNLIKWQFFLLFIMVQKYSGRILKRPIS